MNEKAFIGQQPKGNRFFSKRVLWLWLFLFLVIFAVLVFATHTSADVLPGEYSYSCELFVEWDSPNVACDWVQYRLGYPAFVSYSNETLEHNGEIVILEFNLEFFVFDIFFVLLLSYLFAFLLESVFLHKQAHTHVN